MVTYQVCQRANDPRCKAMFEDNLNFMEVRMRTNRGRFDVSSILVLVALLWTLTGAAALSQTPTAGAQSQTRTRASDGAEMVYVPEGDFLMGSADSDAQANVDEKPQHTVFLNAYWIDKHEVTNAQYEKCVAAGACREVVVAGATGFDGPRQPVVGVSWDDAVAYGKWVGGRLPTEAEWEKAARGTDGRIYPWGNDWDPTRLDSKEDGPGSTTDVGSYPAGASPYGALDMAGNVWDWVSDWFGRPDASEPQRNPTGPAAGTDKVMRGGSWADSQFNCRTAARFADDPISHSIRTGFRLVMSTGS